MFFIQSKFGIYQLYYDIIIKQYLKEQNYVNLQSIAINDNCTLLLPSYQEKKKNVYWRMGAEKDKYGKIFYYFCGVYK